MFCVPIPHMTLTDWSIMLAVLLLGVNLGYMVAGKRWIAK